jgi:hypothetical protein
MSTPTPEQVAAAAHAAVHRRDQTAQLIGVMTSATSERGVPFRVTDYSHSTRAEAVTRLRARGWRFDSEQNEDEVYMRVTEVGR